MSNAADQDLTPNASTPFPDPNRHLVEVPDSFAIARWRRDADVATIARCILGTLKYEPHAANTTLVPVGNLRSEISVMQAAQNWHCQRATDSLDGTRDRRVLVQR